MTDLIENLREKHDIIINRVERTRRDVVLEAENSLKKVGANIIESVLYGVENSKVKYYYENKRDKKIKNY